MCTMRRLKRSISSASPARFAASYRVGKSKIGVVVAVEQAFAKLKALLRKASERDLLTHAGYASI